MNISGKGAVPLRFSSELVAKQSSSTSSSTTQASTVSGFAIRQTGRLADPNEVQRLQSVFARSGVRLAGADQELEERQDILERLRDTVSELRALSREAANTSSFNSDGTEIRSPFDNIDARFQKSLRKAQDLIRSAREVGIDLLDKDKLEETLDDLGIDVQVAGELVQLFRAVAGEDSKLGTDPVSVDDVLVSVTIAGGGAGTGSFGTANTFNMTGPLAGLNDIGVGDADNDGEDDVFTLQSTEVFVNISNGDGTFDENQKVTLATAREAIAVGNLDGDGDDEFVVFGSDGSDRWNLYDRSGGTYSEAVSGTASSADTPGGVVLGDVDGDTNLDIIEWTFNAGAVDIYTFENTGSLNFNTAQTTNYGKPLSIFEGAAVFDANGSGKSDLAFTDTGENEVVIFTADGDGTFTYSQTVGTHGGVNVGIAAANLDGDSEIELIVATDTGVEILNSSAGTYSLSATYELDAASDATDVIVGDVNNDGHTDIIAVDSQDKFHLLLNDGTGTFTIAQSTSTLDTPIIAGGDFDNDSKFDIAIGGHNSGTGPNNYGHVHFGDGTAGSGSSEKSLAVATQENINKPLEGLNLKNEAQARVARDVLERLDDIIQVDLKGLERVRDEITDARDAAFTVSSILGEFASEITDFTSAETLANNISARIQSALGSEFSLTSHSKIDSLFAIDLLNGS